MTTQDLKQIDELLEKKFDKKLNNVATKYDLNRFATKADLDEQTIQLENTMGKMTEEILDAVDTSMVYKRDLHKSKN